jgi:hypothetical protein
MGLFYFGQVFSVLWRLPVPEWAVFSRFGKFSVIILLNILQIPFLGPLLLLQWPCQVWFFDGVSEFFHIPFTGLELSD